jgi:membrane protease YdiL (CAAX protease family)
LRAAIRGWKWQTEFWLVVAVVFGPFIARSLWSALNHETVQMTSASLWRLVGYELTVGALMLFVLRDRHATALRAVQRPSARDALVGGVLALVAWLCYTAAWISSTLLVPGSIEGLGAAYDMQPHVGYAVVVLVSLVNPVFEEGFLCGYLVSALASRLGANAAVAISVSIRLLYHVYQGPIAILSVVPMGAILALWYLRTRRIWPPIIAHACLDCFALLPFA